MDGLPAPQCALGDANQGSKGGMDFWIIAMALFVVSSLLGGLNYISTILNMRTKGMSMTRLPLTIWAILFTAILGVLSFPVLLSGLILLLFDSQGGTSFLFIDIFISATQRRNPPSKRERDPVPASLLVPGSPRSLHHYITRYGSCFRGDGRKCTKTDFRIYGHGRFVICDHHPRFPGLGTPHVCNGIEPIARFRFCIADFIDCHSIGHKSFQLDHHALEGKYPVHTGDAFCDRFCELVYFRWIELVSSF